MRPSIGISALASVILVVSLIILVPRQNTQRRQATELQRETSGPQKDGRTSSKRQLIAKTLKVHPAIPKGSPYHNAVRNFLMGWDDDTGIIDGKPAQTGAYPWHVSLGNPRIPGPYWDHFCGGSVYSTKWVITAAHCVYELEPSEVVVLAGQTVLKGGVKPNKVKTIIVHGDFKSTLHEHDIALLELDEPLTIGNNIKPIQLLSPTDEGKYFSEGRLLRVVGWGATYDHGNPVREMKYLDVPYVLRADCNQPWAHNCTVTDNMFCAGFVDGNGDHCNGDSGSPITADRANPKLAGIVSWDGANRCAQRFKVGVYTRISKYLPWIDHCVSKSPKCHSYKGKSKLKTRLFRTPVNSV